MRRSKLVLVLLLGTFAFAATAATGGCNTIEGIGKDISSAARTVKQAF